MNERRIIAMVSQKVARLRRIGEIGHSMENHPNTVNWRERRTERLPEPEEES